MRLKTRRHNPRMPLVDPSDPLIAATPRTLWSPPKGLNTDDPTTRVPNEYVREVRNMWLDQGVMRSRYGTTELGTTPGDAESTAVQICKFTQSSQIGHILRFAPAAVGRWNGSDFTDLGITPAGSADDLWAWAGFGDSLVFSNGVDGLYVYDPVSGTASIISDGPAAKYLTTLDGRIIASNVVHEGSTKTARIMWSGKNDSEDWDTEGESAGYEDLVSTPGGAIDSQLGVYPVSDYIALVVRTRSIWQMTTSGNPIAPFRFSRLYAEIGTSAPYTIVAVSGGIIGLFDDNVYMITQNSIEDIGTKVFDEIIASTPNLGKAYGAYNLATKEYILGTGGTDVFRYSFKDKGWSRSEYTRAVVWGIYGKEAWRGETWGEATGTWNEATGTWADAAKSTNDEEGMLFLADDGLSFVEDSTATDDEVGGSNTDAPIEIASAVLESGSPLHRIRIIELQMEYEAFASQTLTFDYSYDDGANWNTYSTIDITATNGPTLLSVRNEFTHRQLQIRVTSTTLGQLSVISVFPFLVEDVRVHH